MAARGFPECFAVFGSGRSEDGGHGGVARVANCGPDGGEQVRADCSLSFSLSMDTYQKRKMLGLGGLALIP